MPWYRWLEMILSHTHTPLEDKNILVLWLLVMEYFIHLHGHGLPWPHIIHLSEPALNVLIHPAAQRDQYCTCNTCCTRLIDRRYLWGVWKVYTLLIPPQYTCKGMKTLSHNHLIQTTFTTNMTSTLWDAWLLQFLWPTEFESPPSVHLAEMGGCYLKTENERLPFASGQSNILVVEL